MTHDPHQCDCETVTVTYPMPTQMKACDIERLYGLPAWWFQNDLPPIEFLVEPEKQS